MNIATVQNTTVIQLFGAPSMIELALQEAANTFPGRFEVIRVGHGGFSLEPIMPPTRAGSQQST